MIETSMFEKVKKILIEHEGRKQRTYIDTVGNITAGIGHNLSAHDISNDIIERWFYEDVNFFYEKLSKLSWFNKLNEARQIALIDMAFMGWGNFLGFKDMIKAFEEDNLDKAANEIIDSEYGRKFTKRANDIANIIRTGTYEF
jgi:lysozyme